MFDDLSLADTYLEVFDIVLMEFFSYSTYSFNQLWNQLSFMAKNWENEVCII